jgi:ligand-binding sensor domain-containing protein
MKILRIILLGIIFMLFGAKLYAQKASCRKYSVQDGLPQSQVTSIVHDSRGFSWISTRNGLSRFDGIEFVNYFRSDGLPDNQVVGIFEDNYKKLWTLSGSGLSRYNGNGFDYFPPPPEFSHWAFGSSPATDSINHIFVWAENPGKTVKRIVVFDNGIYKDYSAMYPALDTVNLKETCFDKSDGGLFLLDKYQRIRLWKNNKLSLVSGGRLFQSVFPEQNTILARSNDSVFKYDGTRFELFDFKASSGRLTANKYTNFADRQLEIYNGKETYSIDLPFNFSSFAIDRENVIWFSSEGNMYRLLSSAFSIFYDEDMNLGNVWAIAEDRYGHIFFGSLHNSLVEFDGNRFHERNEFRSLFKKEISFYKGSRRMSNGDVWLSTNAGVLIWNGKSFSVLKGIPENTQICYIYEDTDRQIVMLGTEKGLFILRNNKIDLLTDFTDSGLGVIEGITKDDFGVYWLSGHRGVVKYDGKKPVVVRENILPEESTYTIEKDNFGGLWVTSENGLYYRSKGSGSFIHGLPEPINGPANSIIRMDNTHILVGRVNDICIIDLDKFYSNEKNYFRMYDNTDGFMGSDCLDNGVINDRSGRMWILTSDKTVIFDPQKLKKNLIPPQLCITGFHYETDSLTWETVDKSNCFYDVPPNIKLNKFQNKIQISFCGISTTNPEKVKLQYRLVGYDDKWSIPSGKRIAVYEKLPPGHYRFQLKASNADGAETIQPLTLGITMIPTIWQTAIFKIVIFFLCIFITISLSLFLIKRNLKRKEEATKLRGELSRLQMNSVLRQFDPHFTFNVISAIGSLIMKGEKENAYDYITILGGLLRTVLGEGSVIIKPLSDEVDFVTRYCELQKLRFKERISFSLMISKDVDLQRTIPKMTIQLFVENAIKHGFEDRQGGGKVDVTICNNKHAMEIRIIDNGIGRVAALRQMAEGSGSGLKMITTLFEATNTHNASFSTIEIIDLEENGAAAGTSVKIVIPHDYRFEFGNSIAN